MQRQALLAVTLCTLGLTGFTLARTGWFQTLPESPVAAQPDVSATEAEQQQPFASQAALQWRNGEVHHWRAYLLQP